MGNIYLSNEDIIALKKYMVKKTQAKYFCLKNIDETRNYLIEEINQN